MKEINDFLIVYIFETGNKNNMTSGVSVSLLLIKSIKCTSLVPKGKSKATRRKNLVKYVYQFNQASYIIIINKRIKKSKQ